MCLFKVVSGDAHGFCLVSTYLGGVWGLVKRALTFVEWFAALNAPQNTLHVRGAISDHLEQVSEKRDWSFVE